MLRSIQKIEEKMFLRCNWEVLLDKALNITVEIMTYLKFKMLSEWHEKYTVTKDNSNDNKIPIQYMPIYKAFNKLSTQTAVFLYSSSTAIYTVHLMVHFLCI